MRWMRLPLSARSLLSANIRSTLSTVLGTIAIVAATSNVVGGFIITDRMLKMFKVEPPAETMTSVIATDHVIEITYICRHSAFHLVAEMDEFAEHGAARSVWPAKSGCCWPSWRRCCIAASSDTNGLPLRWCSDRLSAFRWAVAMTAVPQRTALSHAFGALLRDAGRHGGILSAHAEYAAA